MSESLAKQRPSINVDEFDQRLRQHDDRSARNGDPLAELARLVGENHDPYGEMFAKEPQFHDTQPHDAAAPAYAAGRREPAFATSGASAAEMSPRLSGDFAAIEAGLRGAISAHPEVAAPMNAAEHEFFAQHEAYQQPEGYAQDPQAYVQDHEAERWAAPMPPGGRRSAKAPSRSVYAMVATIAVCTVGIGVAFAYKGASSSPGAIKTIAAASGPTKIQPPAEAANDQGGQESSILGKKSPDAPTQLVSREEQPVDLSQAVQDSASRNADTGAAAPGDAANVPVPPSPSQTRGAQSADMMGFGVGMPSPKRVKVVSVRPDGTILPNDAPPSAALPAPHQASYDQDPIARASTPKADEAPKTDGTPKTTSRVSGASKRAKVADGDDAPVAKPSKAKQRLASVEPTDDQTASLGARSGGFAVQLAAPGSEADARSVSSRLAKKFSAALSGHRLGFHKAQSNGKSVYRVRVGSLSREDATSLCTKLKADGGSCFVAKNN